MDIIATITNILPVESGVSRAGNEWKKQTIIVEHGDKYPATLAITLMGATIDKYAASLAIGQAWRFYLDADSREFNGRWYTDIRAWKIEPPAVTQPLPTPTPMPTAAPTTLFPGYQPQSSLPIENNGLPF